MLHLPCTTSGMINFSLVTMHTFWILVNRIFLFLCRNSEYLGAEQFGFMHDTHRVTAETRNYDPPVSSQPELMKQDIPQATREHEYITSLSLPGNSMNDLQQSDSNFPFVAELNERNLPSLPSETVILNFRDFLLSLIPGFSCLK